MGAVRRSQMLKSGALSFLEWGSGGRPTLLFSHANGFNAETYADLLEPLSAEFHVLACDLRGHGRSMLATAPGLAKDWSVFADDLVEFLVALDCGPVLLAGHSLGATASFLAAARAPALVHALVLGEPVLLPKHSEGPRGSNLSLAQMAAQRRKLFPSADAARDYYRGRGIFAQWPERALTGYVDSGLVKTAEGFRLACAPEWESEVFRDAPLGKADAAGGICCPLTILRGTVASTATAGEVATIQNLKQDTRVVTIDGATHFLPIERPATVREEILRFAVA